jgi:beta-lactamase superfamily II metal-dependent hydrolase
MFRLHVLQAAFVDCLALEYGRNSPRYILIDGGSQDIFRFHLRPWLEQIEQHGAVLDLVVQSHVDNDHVIGLLGYFSQLRASPEGLRMPLGLWHNSFTASIDPNDFITPRLRALVTPGRASLMNASGMAVRGIEEGSNLRTQATALSIPVNLHFQSGLITVESAPSVLHFDDLELTIVGPTQTNLDALEQEWIEWIESQEGIIQSDNPNLMANADRSVPNLSSIMFLARGGGRTMLLTGDGRSDHLLDGLGQAGVLDANGEIHVNILKLPHHGSHLNITKRFFRKIKADIYVASANGRDNNPDLATLIWLIEAAQIQQRNVEIVMTNQTPSVRKLLDEYPTAVYGYTIKTLPSDQYSFVV